MAIASRRLPRGRRSTGRSSNSTKEKLAAAEKTLQAVPKVAPDAAAKENADRNERLSAAYKQFAAAYARLAKKTKALDLRSVNRDLTAWLFFEGMILDRVGKSYEELASSVSAGVSNNMPQRWPRPSKNCCRSCGDSTTEDYRIKLSAAFDHDFPTIEQTAKKAQGDGGRTEGFAVGGMQAVGRKGRAGSGHDPDQR